MSQLLDIECIPRLEAEVARLNEIIRIQEDKIYQLEHKDEKLKQLAYLDSLTNIFNRRKFDDDWKELVNSKRNTLVTCMMIDCNDFSSINNTAGHLEGDRVLQLIATTLQHTLRDEDCLYRYGGDEFVILLKNVSLSNADATAKRCVEAIGRVNFEQTTPVQISIGVTQANTLNKTEIENCLHDADKMMYKAKHSQSHVCVQK